MLIFPAIDIKGGVCVRLKKGDFMTAEKVAADALITAESFRKAGALWLHIVDLDGAKGGKRPNIRLIKRIIAECGMKTEVGGGIRDMHEIEDYLKSGAERVVIGSAALLYPGFLKKAASEFGSSIALGIDARNGKAAVRGWTVTTRTDYLDLAKKAEQSGVEYIIFTDIECDGMLSGPNTEELKKLLMSVSCNITASGGIKDIDDIKKLAEMGLYGAICGKSIYAGTLDLPQAIAAGRRQNAC